MTLTEELSQRLYIEYGTYAQLQRKYQKGQIERTRVITRLNFECHIIQKLKRRCKQELLEEDYPAEYYFPDPIPADEWLASLGNESSQQTQTGSPASQETNSSAPQVLPDPEDTGVQLSIFDLYGSCL